MQNELLPWVQKFRNLKLKPQSNHSKDFEYSPRTRQIKIYKGTILVVCVISLLLLTANIFADRELSARKTQMEKLTSELEAFGETETIYVNTAKRLNLYKETKIKQQPVQEKVSLVYGNVAPSVILHKAVIDQVHFALSMEGPNALIFAEMISQYLSEKSIDQIIF